MDIIVTSACCVSHHVLQSAYSSSSSSARLSWPAYPTPATFHCLNSHWMENSWFGDCPKHIMPNSSMNSHLPLPSPLSSVLPCSLSSFKVWPHSWNKRKTAFMRTCFSPTYGTHCLSSFFLNLFPNLTPWWHSGVMASSALDKLKNAEISYSQTHPQILSTEWVLSQSPSDIWKHACASKEKKTQNIIVFTFINIIIFLAGVLIPSVMIATSWLITIAGTTFSSSSAVDWQRASFWADKVWLYSIIHVKILSKLPLPLSFLFERFKYRSRFIAV